MSRNEPDLARAPDDLLAEQQAYYGALAPEYEKHALEAVGGDELVAAVDGFRPAGDVLELACGPGTWTPQLLRDADAVTAVDGSREMLEIAAARVGGDPRVVFVQADLFTWRAPRRFDAVFFGFWISHVPLDRFASFWSLVADCLKPGGVAMFVDDAHRTADELAYGRDSELVRRRLREGRAYRVVKVAHEAAELERRIARLGWDVTVTSTSGPFYWGVARPSGRVAPGPDGDENSPKMG